MVPPVIYPNHTSEPLSVLCTALRSPHRISTGDDRIDQVRDGPMCFRFAFCSDGAFVRGRCIAQYAQDLVLGKHPVIVHGKKHHLADRERCQSRMVVRR